MYPLLDPDSGKYGYWSNGDWAVDPEFKWASPFHSGFVAVDTVDGQSCLFTTDQRIIELRDICNGRPIVNDQLVVFVDMKNRNTNIASVTTETNGTREPIDKAARIQPN